MLMLQGLSAPASVSVCECHVHNGLLLGVGAASFGTKVCFYSGCKMTDTLEEDVNAKCVV